MTCLLRLHKKSRHAVCKVRPSCCVSCGIPGFSRKSIEGKAFLRPEVADPPRYFDNDSRTAAAITLQTSIFDEKSSRSARRCRLRSAIAKALSQVDCFAVIPEHNIHEARTAIAVTKHGVARLVGLQRKSSGGTRVLIS
jgi:hypothetical protein